MSDRPEAAPAPPRVAIIVEGSNAYGRGLLIGIRRFVHEHGPWVLFMPEHGRGMPPLDAIRRWRGEAMIARIETPGLADAIRDLRGERELHLVDVSAAGLIPGTPCVETDDRAIGRLAALHFQQRRFSSFAFVGDERFRWSRNRCQAFIEAVGDSGPVAVYNADSETGTNGELAAWLRAIPKPVGLLACYDVRGREVIDACRDSGLTVPDEVSVLGVDDDPLLCSLASTPMSSIIPDAEGAGWRAADVIARLLAGERLDRDLWLLPPIGLTQRQSTATIATDDPIVAAALQHIREHACRGIKVGDVARALETTRHVLTSRFLKHTGHSPHEEILRVQFRQVETLLLETELPLAEIASRAGFRHAEYMTVAFRRRYGMPPSHWRRSRQRPA